LTAINKFGKKCTQALEKKLGSTFSIRVYSKRIDMDQPNYPSCIGQIRIDDFRETFIMPLKWHSVAQYEKQWKIGLGRLQLHNSTCLIARIGGTGKNVGAEIWRLYKKGTKVYIQNQWFFGDYLEKKLAILNIPLNMKTCYEFINKTPSKKASTWKIALSEVLSFKVIPAAQEMRSKNL
jgi:hypothetical protein